MITKRDKVQIVLRSSEIVVFKHIKNILEDYVNNCEDNDLIDLNDQIFEYSGVECAIGSVCDILQYICDNAIIED